MNLHDLLMELGATHHRMNGKGFSDLITFHLAERTIRNGNVVLMDKGKIIPQIIKFNDKELMLEDDLGKLNEEFYSGLERRYEEYYNSRPNKNENYGKCNFIAKKLDEMSFDDMENSKERQVTRYELEWWVVANAVADNIKWNNKHWYWQSKKNPKLVLFRKDVKGDA